MRYYNEKIDETIKHHNEKIYGDLNSFLNGTSHRLCMARARCTERQSDRLGNLAADIQREQASQVPTCLVITSSESASSIDT